MAGAADRPVLVFDGDCAFCTSSARALGRIGPRAAVVPWQEADLEALGITAEQAIEAVQWVAADGAVLSGHRAIAATLATAGRGWRLIGRILTLPVISPLAAVVYRWVADNRHRLPGGTPACAVDQGATGSAPSRIRH